MLNAKQTSKDFSRGKHSQSLSIKSKGFRKITGWSGWWFGTWLLFSIIYGIILPIDFHIFQRGRSTTNQINMGRGPSSPSREKHNVVLFDTIQLNSLFLGLNLQ